MSGCKRGVKSAIAWLCSICISFSLLFVVKGVVRGDEINKNKKEEAEKYTRKSITYLKMIYPPRIEALSQEVEFLSGFDLVGFIEKKIREAVEMKRFDYNDVKIPEGANINDIAHLVKTYIDEVKVDRARAEAKMDWRFKDLVITADDIKRIAESAYLYRPEIRKFHVKRKIVYDRDSGDITETIKQIFLPFSGQIKKRDGKAKDIIEVSIGVNVRYWRVDFDTGDPRDVAQIYAEHKNSVVVGEDKIFETPLEAFIRCTDEAVFWLSRKINAETRKIPDFLLYGPVASVSAFKVFSPITKRDGAYLDSDFAVMERVEEETLPKNGAGEIGAGEIGAGEKGEKKEAEARKEERKIKEIRVGWARARKIVEDESSLSEFQILAGSPEVGQLIKEYPLVGVGAFIMGGYILGPKLTDTKGEVSKNGILISIRPKANLATAFSVNLSELYLIGGAGFTFLQGGIDIAGYGGLRKKFYIRSLALAPQMLIGYSRLFIPVETGEEIAQGESIGIIPSLSLEMFFHPRFSVFVSAEYKLFTKVESAKYKIFDVEREVEIEYIPSGLLLGGGFEVTIF